VAQHAEGRGQVWKGWGREQTGNTGRRPHWTQHLMLFLADVKGRAMDATKRAEARYSQGLGFLKCYKIIVK
jgi:hypothetical protein